MIHQDVFVFNSAFSIPASMEKRKSMAELLVRINYRMALAISTCVLLMGLWNCEVLFY